MSRSKKGAGVVLAMMFLFAISGCTGDGWTHENGTGMPAKPKVEQPGTPACECPAKGTYCRIESAGKSLKCQIFLGGCETNTSVCKVEAGSSKISPCDDADASTTEAWVDTMGTNASNWTPWSKDRFVCKSGTSQSCVNTGCSAGYACNHMSGLCELADPDFFPCKTMTCTPDTEECICDSGNVLCYQRQGLCFHKNGVEACAAKDKSWWTVTCFSGTTCQGGKCVQVGSGQTGCVVSGCATGQVCNQATGQCQAAGGSSTQGQVPCVVRRKDATSWHQLWGGSVVSFENAPTGGWTSPVSPNSVGVASLTLQSGHAWLTFLPQITSTSTPTYGLGLVNGVPEIVGEWEVQCDANPPFTFKKGQTPQCATNLNVAVNTGCWSWVEEKQGSVVVQNHFRLVFKGR